MEAAGSGCIRQPYHGAKPAEPFGKAATGLTILDKLPGRTAMPVPPPDVTGTCKRSMSLLCFIFNEMKSKTFLYIALGTDILIAVTKFTVAAITGSSAMRAEGIHSVIDAISQVLLIRGTIISRKKADALRPFGYGKELYFWSFIVSLIIFMMGGCLSLYEGIIHFKKPFSGESLVWTYVVLGVSFVFTVISAISSFNAFNKNRGDASFWQAVLASKDPSVFIVVLGDLGDIAGLILAFAGVLLGHIFHNPYFDGAASILIGIVLILISLLLVRESRSLLMGETIRISTMKEVTAIVESDDAIISMRHGLSQYLGPDEIVLQLHVVFKSELTTKDITDAIGRVIKKIQERYPLIKQIFIEPVTAS